MRARGVVVGVMAAAAMCVGGAVSVSANVAWCVSDPTDHVDTQSGANLTVNTYVGVPKPEVKYLNNVQSDATTAPDGNGGTLITVHVSLPAGLSNARVTSTVNRYNVSSSATGQGGSVVILYLDVPRS